MIVVGLTSQTVWLVNGKRPIMLPLPTSIHDANWLDVDDTLLVLELALKIEPGSLLRKNYGKHPDTVPGGKEAGADHTG